MSKTIAIFGAGSGLGLAVARRFGAEGYRVALVARRKERLEELRAALANEGVEAHTFTADLADHTRLGATVDEIGSALGGIDVIEYSPAGITEQPVATLDLDLDNLQPQLDVRLLAPIVLVRHVLPAMIERGEGGLLFGLGSVGSQPVSFMSNVGIAFAGLRNYIYTLNSSLADKGVYAGALTIGALIEKSEAQEKFDAKTAFTSAQGVVRVWPEDLADRFWDMYAKRDRVEEVVGGFEG
ncbi:SDR family NAD(P)-dependent oxidoreductase [Embleya sp. NPDC055664]|uniref:SDR family NAD(P)-dependent oxidoreductase n=1 Tax=Embleya sp. NPDC059237 TaxID=3346784 RepID=UPI00367E200E